MTSNSKPEKVTMFFTMVLGLISIIASTNVYAQTMANSSNPSTSPGANTISVGGMNDNNPASISNADNFTGSIPILQTIINGFKSSITTNLHDAISTAERSLGNNVTTLAAFIHPEKDFLVYRIFAIDSNNLPHKVTVDPGNGSILSSQQISFMEMVKIMHGGSGMMGPQGKGMMDQGMMDQGMMGPQGKGMMDQGMMGPQGKGMMNKSGLR
jgi:hypothetical protein